MAPYFSIILPVYNVGALLERCVLSVLEQDLTDHEIILVDDGSTDGSGPLCDALAAQHSCIRVIHKENGGLSSARNAGLEIAQGQYAWWVDSDDWIEPGALASLYSAAQGCGADVIKFDHFRVQTQKTKICSSAASGIYQNEQVKILQDLAFYGAGTYCLSAWSHIYRLEFLRSNSLSFVSERVIGSEDYLFNLQVLLLAKSVCVLPEALYSYELRQGSLTQRYKADLPKRYGVLREFLREFCRQKGLLSAYESRIDRFYVWHLLRGTCMTHEYCPAQDHTTKQGRKNIRAFLTSDEARAAIAGCDQTGMNAKQRLQLWAMGRRMEWLFYHLFVVKPKRRNRT
ncbi:MAG: glycosyltransferase [Oscillospiraceae bacterium]|nr:glycosyltransferase [Oscillospiraceae bacterium]